MLSPLPAGTRLGRYVIESLIGSGGMGSVYRARDPHLDRLVAVKTVNPGTADAELLKRFDSEAKLVGGLAHPNLLTVHDVGSHDGLAFIVSELLEGETLRERMQRDARVTPSLVAEWALDAARGLAAAHAIGIVHRDLKPENLFLTRAGHVKILDFGIAKRITVPGQSDGDLPTSLTGTGVIIGTVGYMAPEQIVADTVDARADVFALGVVMHELLAGRPPFRRATAIATLNAIVSDATPPLPEGTPRPLVVLVQRCLEKGADRRFTSAHDLSLALELVVSTSGTHAFIEPPAAKAPLTANSLSRRSLLARSAASAALFAVGGATGVVGAQALNASGGASLADFRRLTFRRGLVRSARFTPDGENMVYGALWESEPCRVYTARLDGSDSGRLNVPEANVLAVSSRGELALSLGAQRNGVITYGTLARVPLTGGTPRELQTNVKFADWSPDGAELAIVRGIDGRDRLEYPVGTVLLDPEPGSFTGLGFARVAPDGRSVAYVRYRHQDSLLGYVAMIERGGTEQRLTEESLNTHGLAWRGHEVWFTAADERPLFRALRAVAPGGKARVITRLPGNVSIWDAHPDGRVLLAHTDDRAVLISRRPGDTADRDLSWLDASWCADISVDGTKLLFTETGQGGGPRGSVYLRGTDGSPAVKLAEGMAYTLSADGAWALCGAPDAPVTAPSTSLVLVPTGAGSSKRFSAKGRSVRGASFLPHGFAAVVHAEAANEGSHLYILQFDTGEFTRIANDNVGRWALSPDGTRVAAQIPTQGIHLFDIADGRRVPLAGSLPVDVPLAWINDGVLVARDGDPSAASGRLELINASTGARSEWADLLPQDHAGIMRRLEIAVTPDGQSRAYSWHRASSSLYMTTGLA